MIELRQRQEGWGSAVIPQLSNDLTQAFPELTGFSSRNLGYMIRFSGEYPLAEFLQQPVANLGATAANPILQQLAAQLGSEFVPQAVAKLEQASDPKVPQPAAQLQAALFQVVIDLPWGHNIVLIEKVKDLDTRLFYARGVLEHGWSRAVLVHQIESDLHLRATSQDNNFAATLPDPQSDLAAVDGQLKSERDAPTIGILLCKEKNQVVVEYALRDASKPIAVADYTLKKTLPKELKGELPSVAELKKQLKGDAAS